MLTTNDVPLAQSALLVIDVQDSFTVGARWARRSNPDFERNIVALVEAYRAAGLPVFFFLHTDRDPAFDVRSPYLKVMSFLQPRDDEPVLLKNTRNVFTSTDIEARLAARGVRRLAITGIQTEQCCETSARLAADLGYAVDFVLDATMTFPIPNWDAPGEELGVDEIVERTAYTLRRRFARIVDTERLVAEVGATELVESA